MRKLLIAMLASTMLLGACVTQGGGSGSTPEMRALFEGLKAYRKGQIERAGELFAKILETQPDNAYAHLNLGAVNGELSRREKDPAKREKAIAHYKKAIEVGEQVTAYRVRPGLETVREGEIIRGSKSVADVARDNLKRLGVSDA